MSAPTIQGFQPTQSNENRISTWKTKNVPSQNGRTYVQIREGHDSFPELQGKIVEVVRFEFGGGKVVFKKS